MEDARSGYAPELKFEGYTEAQIGYHAYLLIDARLATGHDMTTLGSDGPAARVSSVTWAGHEFADSARDDTRWNKAMGLVQEKGGTVTLGVLTQLLGALMRGALGLP